MVVISQATPWYLSLVAERPPKVAVGFNPRSAITANHLVAERRWKAGGASVPMKLIADGVAMVQSLLRDEMVWRDGSAAADGLKPTATFGGRSATKDKNQ